MAIIGPLVLIELNPTGPARPFLTELGSSLGIVALVLLALQLLLPSRLQLLAPLGAEVAVRLHRRLSDVMVSLVAAHVAVVMVADPSRLYLLSFFGAPWRAQAAVGSVVALVALSITSMLRRRLRLSYVRWRAVHLTLGTATLLLAVAHTIGVNRYLASGPPLAALAVLTAVGLGSLLVLRGPFLQRSSVRPYVVEEVVPEGGGAATLKLRADGHAGQPFRPGQFAWLKLAGTGPRLAEHPFSYASSARAPARPSFTIQAYGGFSSQASQLEPGTMVMVDGPHGSFRPTPHGDGALLIAGGIGITPSMSVLRTAADDGDTRHFVLIYAARTLDRIIFLDELGQLRERLDLTVVILLSSPPPDWKGHRGRISAALLDRYLPSDLRMWEFLVCGPPPLVDAGVEALTMLGIPGEHVHAERFVTV